MHITDDFARILIDSLQENPPPLDIPELVQLEN